MAVAAAGLSLLLVGAGGDGPCEGLDEVHVSDDRVLCTHGNDPILDPSGQPPASTENPYGDVPAGALPSVPPQCYDDGHSGRRVQVMVLTPQGTKGAQATDAEFRRWIGQVEWTYAQSAARDGGRRHVRWRTEADGQGGCRVNLTRLSLPAGAFSDFQATITALVERGHDRSDRKYLLFVQASVGICGLGTAPIDDRPTDDNAANQQVGYARIDTECWNTGDTGYYSVAAHELAHNLGAVQGSAPHATSGRHCVDEWDLMCYEDSQDARVEVRCDDGSGDTQGAGDLNNRLLDCGQDDYFDAGRPSGYLATHWNVASSRFLARQAGDGKGYDTRPAVSADPLGRPRDFSGSLGQHRPLLPDGYGWEACNLPIVIALVDDEPSTIAVPGLVTGGGTPSAFRQALLDAVAWVNESAGTTVFEVDDRSSGSTDDAAVLDLSPLPGRFGQRPPTEVQVTTRNGRIVDAALTIDEQRAAEGGLLDEWVAQALAQSLGIGRGGAPGDLMDVWPVDGADRAIAGRLLAHLYGPGSCERDRRVDDTAPGNPTQRRTDGSLRQRLVVSPADDQPRKVATAASAYLRGLNGPNWASVVVVCRDDVHADCLAGSALAGDDGPVIFVPGGPAGTLPADVRSEIEAAIAPDGSLFVLGGQRAVSSGIEQQLRQALPGRTIQRIAGSSRFDTAVRIADRVLALRSQQEQGARTATRRTRPVALLARADDPVDAVAAGAYAAANRVPVLLTHSTVLPSESAAWLAAHPGTVAVLGGERAVNPSVFESARSRAGKAVRVSGPNRFATSVAIARSSSLWDQTDVTGPTGAIAVWGRSPSTWNYALAVAPVAATVGVPVLYVGQDEIPAVVSDHLRNLKLAGQVEAITGVIAPSTLAPRIVEAIHDSLLPGLDGNLTATRA